MKYIKWFIYRWGWGMATFRKDKALCIQLYWPYASVLHAGTYFQARAETLAMFKKYESGFSAGFAILGFGVGINWEKKDAKEKR